MFHQLTNSWLISKDSFYKRLLLNTYINQSASQIWILCVSCLSNWMWTRLGVSDTQQQHKHDCSCLLQVQEKDFKLCCHTKLLLQMCLNLLVSTSVFQDTPSTWQVWRITWLNSVMKTQMMKVCWSEPCWEKTSPTWNNFSWKMRETKVYILTENKC